LSRELPYSSEAEQSVIGAIILNQRMDGAEQLHDTFYDARHNMIYAGMSELADEGQPIDLVTLVAQLQNAGQLQDVGGVGYLSKLANSVPSATNIEYYSRIVKQHHIHRLTILRLHELQQMAWKVENPIEVLAEMQAISLELSDRSAQANDFHTAKDIALETFESIEQRSKTKNDGCTGIPSGFIDLDRMTSGFQNSDLIIVAARPSVGKTAFALNIAQNAGIRQKRNVALFSLEMSAKQLVTRMYSAEQNIDATRLRTGFLETDDWNRLTIAVGSIAQSNIFIDDTAFLTVYDIARKCRRLKKTEGLDLIVIDYLQLIAGRKKSENRQQEVSEISRSLKRLAKELDVPVIALSQLSRGVEQRQDKRPMMSDLRESGSIEQDADIVAFLYRDDYYDKESEKKNIIEIIIAKQRNGPVGTVELIFLKNFNKFVTLDRSHQQAQSPKPKNEGSRVPDMYRG